MKRTCEILYSRRETLINAVAGFVVIAAAATSMAQAESITTSTTSEPEFVPENDYPFFDWNPLDGPTEPNS